MTEKAPRGVFSLRKKHKPQEITSIHSQKDFRRTQLFLSPQICIRKTWHMQNLAQVLRKLPDRINTSPIL